MPKKPRNKRVMKRRLTPTEIAYLSDDQSVDPEKDFNLWCYRVGLPGLDGDPEPDELWEQYRDDFLPAFIAKNPGRRPLAWWQWSAPRQPDRGSGWFYEGTLPEPRLRISGKGELHKGYIPEYHYGVPQNWDAETLDSSDPLIFESQTAYLRRHDLLTPQEKKYLASHPELMEPEKIVIDEDEN